MVSELTPIRMGNAYYGRCFDFEYVPTYPDFESFRSWCMKPVDGPGFQAVGAKMIPDLELTDRGNGIARISGSNASVTYVFKALSEMSFVPVRAT
jgi:hypothetical protein